MYVENWAEVYRCTINSIFHVNLLDFLFANFFLND